jgi:hypothetical protein
VKYGRNAVCRPMQVCALSATRARRARRTSLTVKFRVSSSQTNPQSCFASRQNTVRIRHGSRVRSLVVFRPVRGHALSRSERQRSSRSSSSPKRSQIGMVQEEVTVQRSWGRGLRSSCVGFRGAKGDFTLPPAHVTREARNLNHAASSKPSSTKVMILEIVRPNESELRSKAKLSLEWRHRSSGS